jgi:DNA helicase HerA-like ATPase
MPFDLIVGRNASDKKDFGVRGLAYLGKSFVTMGNYTSLSNPIYMDVARSHVILVSGKRGSGKSYSLGVIAEALGDLGAEESGNIASLIFDTMGIYWTMKYKNVKDAELLGEWELGAKNVNVKVFAPFGYYNEFKDKGVDVDAEFAIKISELEASDWVNLFELKFTDSVAVLIEGVVSELREKRVSFGFKDIHGLMRAAKDVNQDTKNAAIALFDAAATWKVFDEEKGTGVRDLISAGTTTVIDLSMYASLGAFNVRALIIGLVSKKIFNERMKARKEEEISAVSHGADYARFRVAREMPLVWIFIDEAHEFLPHELVGKTPASDALVQLLREGRQPGISMVLATQQPGKIHTDAMTQSDIVISHRVTARADVDALNDVTQSYMRSDIAEKLNGLPKLKGSAIILDDNSERIYPMRIRPRFTWHGGEAPMAIRKEDEGI